MTAALRRIAALLLAALWLTAVGCTAGQAPTDTSPGITAANTTAADTHPTEMPSATEPSTQAPTLEVTEPATEPETEPETEPPLGSYELDKSKTYTILFIGNSYTYANNMPVNYFGEFMSVAGYKVKIITITQGGWSLLDFSNPSDEMGKKVESALDKRKFDFVILQDQSTTPALNTQAFYSGVRTLNEKIRNNGAVPVLYATWGRKSGSSILTDYGMTSESMTWKLAAAYEVMGKSLDIPVAHVGLAFHDVTAGASRIELYDADLSHPCPAGSYLAALTLFSRITGVDPTTVDYNGGMGADAAARLKEAARKAVFETPAIPEEYVAEAESQA